MIVELKLVPSIVRTVPPRTEPVSGDTFVIVDEVLMEMADVSS